MTLVNSWCVAKNGVTPTFLNPLAKKNPSGPPSLASLLQALTHIVLVRPSIVHFNTASRGSTYRNIIFSLAVRILRVPYVIHLHGGGYPGFIKTISFWQKRLVLDYFKHAKVIIALTPSWSKFLSEQLNVDNRKISVIPNGTADPGAALKSTVHKSPVPTFVYAGRLTKAKGVPELVSAFNALPENLNAELILVGAGADESVTAAIAESSRNITQLGWCTNAETLAAMAKAWAVILPSHFENMPLTVLESMSVSTAVIASHVGGIPEMIRDNIDGILVPPGDIPELTRSMVELCDLEKAIQYGALGRSVWQEKYTSEKMSASLIDLWSNAQE